MSSCAAYGCVHRDNKTSRSKGMTFHQFPHSEPERVKQWVHLIRRKDWTPSVRSRLCSTHFTPESFTGTGKIRRLCKDAIPTIFSFPKHLQKRQRDSISEVTIKREVPDTSDDVIDNSHAEVTPQRWFVSGNTVLKMPSTTDSTIKKEVKSELDSPFFACHNTL